MSGSLVRAVVLSIVTIASALGVWSVHVFVSRTIGPVAAVLAAIVATLMVASLLLIGAVASSQPRDRGRRQP
jgi:hypothetical protein